jgi:LysR family transcriptional regulator, transcriptional activator for dmlA
MGLTPEGELYLDSARKILGDIDDLEQALGNSKLTPKGLLRVNFTMKVLITF